MDKVEHLRAKLGVKEGEQRELENKREIIGVRASYTIAKYLTSLSERGHLQEIYTEQSNNLN